MKSMKIYTLKNKKLNSRSNLLYYKPNFHNIITKNQVFKNMRIIGGHITNTNFRNAKFIGCDFVNVNLRDSIFRNTQIDNCVFITCNLTNTDFNATYTNKTHFITCNITKSINFPMDNPSVKILNQQPSEKHTNDYLLYMLYYSRKIKRISDYKVLHTNNKTLNTWNIDILLTEYSSKELSILLHKIICGKYSNKRHFYTLNCYREALDNLIKK